MIVAALARYLDERQEQEFFISRFVDYSSDDGLFRKYRIVFVDGRPYACHMAIADRWDIWYLNAGMSRERGQASRRRNFHARLRHRLRAPPSRRRWPASPSGSVSIISRSTARKPEDGSLLIFEADNTAIVHNMDPPDIFPYKPPQMRKIFDAFAAMLERRARHGRERAA